MTIIAILLAFALCHFIRELGQFRKNRWLSSWVDFSNEAFERLNCTYDGDDLEIAFNARFLIEMLGVLETEEVKIELSTPTRAGILVPGEVEDGEQLLMLVMPVMLNH